MHCSSTLQPFYPKLYNTHTLLFPLGKTLINMKGKGKETETFASIDPQTYRLSDLQIPTEWYRDSSDDMYSSNKLSHRVSPPDDLLRRLDSPQDFSVKTLCAAILNKCSVDAMKWYLSLNPTRTRKKLAIDGWLSLYYAAQRNSSQLVSILLQNGVDVPDIDTGLDIPLIAFVVIYGYVEAVDSSQVLKVLLSSGVDPMIIPMDMWQNYLETPQETANTANPLPEVALERSAWCTSKLRSLLTNALHLTHRYLLRLASELAPLRPRMLHIATANSMLELTKLPYYLVGQRPAADIVMKRAYSHVSLNSKMPLVMAFAGASGHGKTELATAMGDLLSVKLCTIDCTKLRDVWALFGSTAGWNRNADGSKLNNFLAANASRRSVVFMDEFDKTEKSVRDALLLITQNGAYEDRRTNTAIDCTQTIWILATNHGDDLINEYYSKNIEKLSEKQRNNVDLKTLQAGLKHEYRNKFGAPFSGRVSCVVPFFPFSKSECAVIAHRFLLNFGSQIRKPIDMNPDSIRLIGHCRLSLEEDGKVCTELSNAFYNKDLGARSLQNAVDSVSTDLSVEYSNSDVLIEEEVNKGPLQGFTVRRIPVGAGAHVVGVSVDKEEFRLGNSEDEMDEVDVENESLEEGYTSDDKGTDKVWPNSRLKKKGRPPGSTAGCLQERN
ncbi:unnamed protein product [Periconia digitata]|uniref:ATPase AAA-type core domain-containing protein n=1 Tax=Periconia digitata TaxID=1303443 RepID=A0A9W4U8Z3_9PLEO|nr:unnamed protein product [Periconia digitata]